MVRRSRTISGTAALWALALLPVAAPARAQYPAPALERPLAQADAADLAEGKRLYTAQCALCHGIDGSGGYGPSLLRPTFVRAADDAGLFSLVRNGIPGLMPGFDANGPKRNWQLAAFALSLTRSGGGSAKGDAAHGRTVYDARGCANCHVLEGQGRALGPDLSTIGRQRGPAYLRQSLVEPAAKVPDGHVVVTAKPANGPAVRGVRVSEDAFWVHVRDMKGELHAFRIADLADLKREAGASLMPAYASLPAGDLDDLVAYLSSLGARR